MCIDVKIGTINIDKDRKLWFENTFENPSNQTLNTSHLVGRTGGGPKSVFSQMSHASTMRSGQTPMTNCSQSSVASNARSSKWSFFKNNCNRNTGVASRHSKNSYIRSEQRRILNSSGNINNISQKEAQVPYPHLVSFIKKHTDNRFGKKMDIDNTQTNRTVMHDQMKQIQDKQIQEQEDKIKRREEELKGYLSLKNGIDRDQKENEIELLNKRREFLNSIEELKQHKTMKQALDKVNSHQYDDNYFPYTHGDNIEKNREDIKGLQNKDMRNYYKNKKTEMMRGSKHSKHSKHDAMSPMSNSRRSMLQSESKKRSASSNQPTEDIFMKPHKTHKYRFLAEECLEDNNRKALKMYERDLLQQRQKRLMLEQELKTQSFATQEYKSEEKERKRKMIEATKKALDEQARQKHDRKLLEFLEEKRHHNTHFGPEEGEELKQFYKDKRENEKQFLKNELKAQIMSKKQVRETDAKLERHIDQVYAQQANNVLQNQKMELQIKKQVDQENNVKAWDLQREIKQKQNQATS